MSCGVGRERGSDPELLWLWCRPAAAAPIRLLAWEPPYAAGTALKRQKRPPPKKNYKGTDLIIQTCFSYNHYFSHISVFK